MIVVAIAGILVTLAIPSFQQSSLKAKEAALKQNLFTLRAVIDQFYADRGQYPATLETLVEEKYPSPTSRGSLHQIIHELARSL